MSTREGLSIPQSVKGSQGNLCQSVTGLLAQVITLAGFTRGKESMNILFSVPCSTLEGESFNVVGNKGFKKPATNSMTKQAADSACNQLGGRVAMIKNKQEFDAYVDTGNCKIESSSIAQTKMKLTFFHSMDIIYDIG